jgi:hypothetical protein
MNNIVDLNLTKIPQELKLILEIVKDVNGGRVLKEDYNNVEWDLFLELAFHHRLYPLLYLKLMEIESGWIPSKVLQTLSHSYKKNTFKMLHLSGEMEMLIKLFVENEIRSLVLKGPVLAKDLYGDLSRRTCGDLDILIPINDLSKAEELLVGLGYEKDEYIKTLLNDWKWRHHHFTYYHPNKGTKIEIHWRLNPSPSEEPNFNELWERKRQSTITSYPIYILSEEDLFYFLVTHGARHGWSRLRWLVDIHQILQKQLNWIAVQKIFKKYQCGKIGGQSLILSTQLLHTNLPKEIRILTASKRSQKLACEALFYLERMVNLHTEPVPNDVAKYHADHLFSLMSFQQKTVYFLSVLHPFYTDVETFPLPKKLHFLYFPLRPFLMFWRKAKKAA